MCLYQSGLARDGEMGVKGEELQQTAVVGSSAAPPPPFPAAVSLHECHTLSNKL